jgi:DNA-binding response OmpR family regulator
LEYVLCRNGFEVAVVHDGETALEVFEKFKPQAVILDLVLPGISGAEVLRRLKQTSLGKHTRVVVVTGCSGRPQLEATIPELADGYCMKPVAPSTLLSALKEISCLDSPTTGVKI